MKPYYEEDGITIYHGDSFDLLHLMDWDPAQDRDDDAEGRLIDGGSLAAGDGWCDCHEPQCTPGIAGEVCGGCGGVVGAF